MRSHTRAKMIFQDRADYADGAILEMTIWEVPCPVKGSEHLLKYSLFYGYAGMRVVGYDNERGKGDHRHLGDRQWPYAFTSPEALVADFLTDVRMVRDER